MSEIKIIENINDLVIGDYYKYGDNMIKITSVNKETGEITFDIINENQFESVANSLQQSNVFNKYKYIEIIDFSNLLLSYIDTNKQQKGGGAAPFLGYPPPYGYPPPFYGGPGRGGPGRGGPGRGGPGRGGPGRGGPPVVGVLPGVGGPLINQIPPGIKKNINRKYAPLNFFYQNISDSYSGIIALNNFLGYFKFRNENNTNNNYTLKNLLNKTNNDTINMNNICNLYKNNYISQEIYECFPEENNIKNYDINLLKISIETIKENGLAGGIYYFNTTDVLKIDSTNTFFSIINSNTIIVDWIIYISLSKTFYVHKNVATNQIDIYNSYDDKVDFDIDINNLNAYSTNTNIQDCQNAEMCFGIEKQIIGITDDIKIEQINKKYKEKYLNDLKNSVDSSDIESEGKNYFSTLYDTVILYQISVVNIIKLTEIINEKNPLKIIEINKFCAKKLLSTNNTIKQEIEDLINSLKLQKILVTTPNSSLKVIPKKYVPRSDLNRIINSDALIPNQNLSRILDKKDIPLKLKFNSSDEQSNYNIYKIVNGGFKKYIKEYKNNKKSIKLFKKSKLKKNNMILKIIE